MAVDGAGNALTWTVTATSTVSISTTSLPSGTVGTSYSATLLANGGTPPYTWSIPAASLPAGLSLASSSGSISGTPSASGISTFTVEVPFHLRALPSRSAAMQKLEVGHDTDSMMVLSMLFRLDQLVSFQLVTSPYPPTAVQKVEFEQDMELIQ